MKYIQEKYSLGSTNNLYIHLYWKLERQSHTQLCRELHYCQMDAMIFKPLIIRLEKLYGRL